MVIEGESKRVMTEALLTDAQELVSLKQAVFEDIQQRFGAGHWPPVSNLSDVERSIAHSRILVCKEGHTIVGMLRLSIEKPWAIDLAYFKPVSKAIYITDMAVLPARQHSGIGSQLIEYASQTAIENDVLALRLDTYDSENGAGAFYLKCGFAERGRASFRGTSLRYFEKML